MHGMLRRLILATGISLVVGVSIADARARVPTCSYLFASEPSVTRSIASIGPELRRELRAQTSERHSPMNYREARRVVIGYLDAYEEAGQVYGEDVYCGYRYHVLSNGLSSGDDINVEHTWPQSKFGKNESRTKKSDMHHLYASDMQLNGIRANHPFGIVTRPIKSTKCSGAKIGYDDNNRLRFEPPDNHKGNVARAIFYFSVRYGIPLDPNDAAMFRQWNREDPVDDTERARNDRVEEYQGNRNPFIDHPELMDQVSDG